jgi:hypothetical protein
VSDVAKYWWRVVAWTIIWTVVLGTAFILVPNIYRGVDVGLSVFDFLWGILVIVWAVWLLRRLGDQTVAAIERWLR